MLLEQGGRTTVTIAPKSKKDQRARAKSDGRGAKISPAKRNLPETERPKPIQLFFSANNEMLHTSTTCPNTSDMMKEAARQGAIAALFDVGARAASQHRVPRYIDKCLGLDLVGRQFSLKSERVAGKAAADIEAASKTTLQQDIADSKQKLVLTDKLAKIGKRR